MCIRAKLLSLSWFILDRRYIHLEVTENADTAFTFTASYRDGAYKTKDVMYVWKNTVAS